jgi:UDP-glucose 4-epimerase
MSELRGKRVLVTGGLGFIGSNVVRRCLALGAKVTVYDCLDPRSGGNMYNVHGVEAEVELVLNDIRNFEGVSAVVRNKDVMISCAAYTSHPNSMKDPLTDIDVNCKGVINLLEATRRFNAEMKIIHIGTSTQIGRMRVNPADESHPEFPLDIYSANKTASEKYVLIYASAYKLRAGVVRLANVFGPRSNIRSPDFGFMNYFIGLGLQGREIPVFGEGAQLRNISYVDDCVEAIVAASASPKSDGEVLFAVADRQYSVGEIADAIARHIGGSVRRVPWPKEREVIEIGDALISNARIREALGWQPTHDLAGGLAKTKQYFGACLAKYL